MDTVHPHVKSEYADGQRRSRTLFWQSFIFVTRFVKESQFFFFQRSEGPDTRQKWGNWDQRLYFHTKLV
mgnify:CR=1 FL=1